MQVVTKAEALISIRKTLLAAQTPVAFAPTMGALHAGHLQLVKKAKASGAFVMVSIFVNPTQFDNPHDLEKYPRMPAKDLQMLESVGCDLVFLPESPEEIYPTTQTINTYDLGALEHVMEGAFRKGHFQGVAAVLDKLFHLVQPHEVFMGEKDFQQVAIVRKLVAILNLPITITAVPTVREPDGLAMSSRNLRLSANTRQNAVAIFKALTFAQENYQKFTPQGLSKHLETFFHNLPEVTVEYIQVADAETLTPITNWGTNAHPRIFIAVWFSGVRLIDNMPLF
jgi:pantoate--beta-alanine ligase